MVIVNPRHIRDLASVLVALTKTDAIDAVALTHFTDAVRPAVRPAVHPLRDAEIQVLSSLVVRRH